MDLGLSSPGKKRPGAHWSKGSALQLPNILKQSKKRLSLCWAGRAILGPIGLYPCVLHRPYFLESVSRKSTRKMQRSACHIMRPFCTPQRCRGSGRTKRTSALWVFIDSKAQLTGTWVEVGKEGCLWAHTYLGIQPIAALSTSHPCPGDVCSSFLWAHLLAQSQIISHFVSDFLSLNMNCHHLFQVVTSFSR